MCACPATPARHRPGREEDDIAGWGVTTGIISCEMRVRERGVARCAVRLGTRGGAGAREEQCGRSSRTTNPFAEGIMRPKRLSAARQHGAAEKASGLGPHPSAGAQGAYRGVLEDQLRPPFSIASDACLTIYYSDDPGNTAYFHGTQLSGTVGYTL